MGRNLLLVLLFSAFVQIAFCQKDLYFVNNRSTIVQLFEWKWEDVEAECQRFLGQKGYGGVQVSPAVENLIVKYTWWEKYQTVSYKLDNRAGNEQAFAKMVKTCNEYGVRIIVDVVFNHMTGSSTSDLGSAGSMINSSEWSYPAIPYNKSHFHSPICLVDNYYNATEVRVCELAGLKDLNQTNEYVREKVVAFLNTLVDHGVAGFRVDAAIHVSPENMGIIFSRVKNLSEAHGFPPGARPYVNQEVIDIAGAISRQEYTPVGAVTEYRASAELGKAFSGKRPLKQLVDWGPEMGLLESGDSVVFVDNHDNQRGHSPTAPDILTYKTPRQYEAATAFMLAHPFGATTCVMSSYDFYDENIGPPFDDNFNIISPSILPNGRCGNGWVCEHRWMTMYMMTDFRRQVFGKALRSWWDNGKNQIAFCRGKKGFVVFNLDDTDLSETLDVCLPAGTYCDILSGGKVGNACVGRTIVVSSNNDAMIQIPTNSSQPIIAIHDGPLSKLS